MKIFTILFAMFAIENPFVTTTTVAQMIYGPDGTLANGSVDIRITANCQTSSGWIGDVSKTVPITNGVFTVDLIPTDNCSTVGNIVGSPWSSVTNFNIGDAITYSGGIYAARVANTNVSPPTAATWLLISPAYSITYHFTNGTQQQEAWMVPTSGTPLLISQVRVQQTGLPAVGLPGIAGCGLVPQDTWAAVESGNARCGILNAITTTWASIEN